MDYFVELYNFILKKIPRLKIFFMKWTFTANHFKDRNCSPAGQQETLSFNKTWFTKYKVTRKDEKKKDSLRFVGQLWFLLSTVFMTMARKEREYSPLVQPNHVPSGHQCQRKTHQEIRIILPDVLLPHCLYRFSTLLNIIQGALWLKSLSPRSRCILFSGCELVEKQVIFYIGRKSTFKKMLTGVGMFISQVGDHMQITISHHIFQGCICTLFLFFNIIWFRCALHYFCISERICKRKDLCVWAPSLLFQVCFIPFDCALCYSFNVIKSFINVIYMFKFWLYFHFYMQSYCMDLYISFNELIHISRALFVMGKLQTRIVLQTKLPNHSIKQCFSINNIEHI